MDALTGGASLAEARALLVLDATPGVGLVTLRALVRAFGSAEAALAAPHGAFAQIAGAEAARGRDDRALRAEVDAALARAERLGMEIRTWASEGYPRALLALHDPPPVLFLRGRSELLERPAATVIGSRRATERGRNLAARLAGALARAGMPVASGLALGVDAAAHRGALDAGGDTIAVLGRGADAPYPSAHRRLFRRILERGLLVSEFLPGTPALAHNFPRRNRILAALSCAVVVVEAGERSGAFITVDHALDLGIDVWAVPGPIEHPACVGSNRLLAEGARPLLSIRSFVSELTGADPDAPLPVELPPGPARELLAGLGHDTLSVDELAARAGMPAARALALLAELELGGLVKQLPGMRYRAA
ncbi:MAG TPA: DNA-processing protein DprA [Longimicrobiales bacterium]|nr:DNA-processing protein DprA [Longimicrobiales bacterium]